MPSASYVAANQFSASGDISDGMLEGLRLKLIQGVDGTAEVTVDSATYSVGSDTTTVTLKQSTVTSNLATVLVAASKSYSQSSPASGNIGRHLHLAETDAGDIPAAHLSQGQVDGIMTLPSASGNGNKLVGIDAGGTGYEAKSLTGVANRTTITHSVGGIEVTTPQDSHTGATPTFSGLTLSSLMGLLLANAGSPLTVLSAAGNTNKIVGVNADALDFEVKSVTGVANRTTVTHSAGGIEITTPQDSHTAATPTFAGMTLSGLLGVLVGNNSSALSAVVASAALQVLRRNAANNAYEFATLSLSDMADVVIVGTAGEDLAQYEVVYADPDDSGTWKAAFNNGTEIQAKARGVVVEAGGITNGATGSIQRLGKITNTAWEWTPGALLYVSGIPGVFTEDKPESGEYIEAVAQAEDDGDSIWFVGVGGGGGAGSVSWKGDWATSTAYALHDMVLHNGALWVCSDAHTSSRANEPGVGSYWGDHWDLVVAAGTMTWRGPWGTATYYSVNDLVSNDGDVFICTDAHTSGASDEPGTGTYYGDYWDVFVSSSAGDDNVQTLTAGEALDQYDVVYADATDSGKVKKATKNGTEAQANAIGIVVESGGIANGATGDVRLFGLMTNGSWTWTPGGDTFLGNAGALTQTQTTTTGEWVKPMGWAPTSTSQWVNPQTGWQVT